MSSVIDYLSKYAAYHRDRRNIATHFVGVPMIVAAVAILMSRPAFAHVDGVAITPALFAVVILALFYVRLDIRFGTAMAVFLGFCLWLGHFFAAQSMLNWLAAGVGMFVVGWIIQFVGHYYEGKKPAFVDDIMGLAIGPIFVAAELAFEFGLRKDIEEAVVARVGPTHIRQMKVA